MPTDSEVRGSGRSGGRRAARGSLFGPAAVMRISALTFSSVRSLGEHHSAETIMYGVDFAEVERPQRENRWEEAARLLIETARRVERGGADFLALCTNSMHKGTRWRTKPPRP